MTSTRFDREKAHAEAEMLIFDNLSAPLRAACTRTGVSASVVLSALLRGVTESQILERLQRSQNG